MKDFFNIIGAMFGYLLWLTLLLAWVFTDIIREAPTNELIMVITFILIMVLKNQGDK